MVAMRRGGRFVVNLPLALPLLAAAAFPFDIRRRRRALRRELTRRENRP
jgi:hypothetical protein